MTQARKYASDPGTRRLVGIQIFASVRTCSPNCSLI